MRFGFAFAALVLLGRPARAQNIIGARDSLSARVDSIFRVFDRSDSPGCAIGVYRDGRIVYARGYGMANLELGVPITSRTVFDIGSIAKQFTATAVLLLAQDGKLSLDDVVSRHFPEMPAYASTITIRQLLNHTSGLRDWGTLFDLAGRSFEGIADTLDFLRLITRSAEPNFPPGTRYHYSNSGYILAGQLVYRVTGRSLGTFLKQRVFDPLGMTDTRFRDDHTLIVPNRAQAYAPHGTGFRIRMGQFDGSGAGGVQTTVEDFARWDRNWNSATVAGRALVQSLLDRGRLRNDSVINYALGVWVDTYRGLRTVDHGGGTRGYVSYYVRFPDQKLSIACFCNLLTADAGGLATEVATLYLGGQMAPDTNAWEAALLAAPAVAIPAEDLRRFDGVWRSVELGQTRRTRLAGDSLMLYVPWVAQALRLVHLGDNRFRLDRPLRELVFDGRTDALRRLRVHSRGGTETWERVDGVRLTAAHLAEYAGEYRSEEIETTYTLAPDTAGFLIRIRGRQLGTLQPVWRDAFMLVHEGESGSYLTGTDLTGALFEFTRDGRGRITGFAIQAGRVRNLRVTRQR